MGSFSFLERWVMWIINAEDIYPKVTFHLFNKCSKKIECLYVKSKNLDRGFRLFMKINSIWIMDLNLEC